MVVGIYKCTWRGECHECCKVVSKSNFFSILMGQQFMGWEKKMCTFSRFKEKNS